MTDHPLPDRGTVLPVRGSGILLHVTSLPSRFGIGDAGPAAFAFADRLFQARQKYWQVLPLNPTSAASGHSPYHPTSSRALNPLFLSPEILARDGLAGDRDIALLGREEGPFVEYDRVVPRRREFLAGVAHSGLYGKDDPLFEDFCAENASWLEDFALFSAISMRCGDLWTAWPPGLRDREPAALQGVYQTLGTGIDEARYLQFLIHGQWETLRARCRERGVSIICDLPMFVAHGSVDAWAHRELFKLAENGAPRFTAGVPPDYFSSCGQRWGNPVYDWDTMERQGFTWWTGRIRHLLTLCDLVRIDHFRGLSAYWEIPAASGDPRDGRWVPVPGRALLSAVSRLRTPLIAEDLGTITPDVRALMAEFRIPGMRVLQFGFDGGEGNPHAPGNVEREVVLYTGTHDNNTLRGWLEEEAGPGERERLAALVGDLSRPDRVIRKMISLALESPAQVVIFPLQDLLSLPSTARMNRPGTCAGNWRWRLPPGLPAEEDWHWLSGETARTGRG